MTATPLPLTRNQILAFRRRVGGLESRRRRGPRSLRRAAWAGLQDSMPRAAVLSVHARVSGATSSVWEDPAYVQVWGPRYSAYVIPKQDLPVFTLGRLPSPGKGRDRAFGLAAELGAQVRGRSLPLAEVGTALGRNPNVLRYAATTGTVLIRWDGARHPTVSTVVAPDIDPAAAQKELGRRYLHVFGPSTPEAFARWAGIRLRAAIATFDRLHRSLTPVQTPIGPAWLLNRDVDSMRNPAPSAGVVRLLPSGDSYFLLHGDERALLVPNRAHRDRLWTSRVWPGAILVDGVIVGTWRRAKARLTASPWIRLTKESRNAVEAEAATLPLPEPGAITVEWEQPSAGGPVASPATS